MSQVQDDEHCFACGRANPIGLKLSFDLDLIERKVTTVFQPDRRHQGWKNRLHGGLLSTVMDEVMVNAAYMMDIPAVTGEMTIRFRSPTDTQQRLTFTGRITEVRAKFLQAVAECRTDDGTSIADARALLIRIPT